MIAARQGPKAPARPLGSVPLQSRVCVWCPRPRGSQPGSQGGLALRAGEGAAGCGSCQGWSRVGRAGGVRHKEVLYAAWQSPGLWFLT